MTAVFSQTASHTADNFARWTTTFVLTIVFGSTIFLFSCNNNSSRQSKKAFDQQEWKENENSRFAMLDSIVSSKMLIGKSKSKVISLLGKPTFMLQEYSDGTMQYSTSVRREGYGYENWFLFVGLKNDTVVYTRKE